MQKIFEIKQGVPEIWGFKGLEMILLRETKKRKKYHCAPQQKNKHHAPRKTLPRIINFFAPSQTHFWHNPTLNTIKLDQLFFTADRFYFLHYL